ncbi:hypothetical protein FCULG_00012704 [Fusarium culmorum]|uniref:Uncharacterized protein n=1 Tax=Fusarium culmorum TaxID=5516 RepID=A0A2T4GC79_FUSCU|nr:hypothetical protein FCULG_00012704 [Fusarium culmorum]
MNLITVALSLFFLSLCHEKIKSVIIPVVMRHRVIATAYATQMRRALRPVARTLDVFKEWAVRIAHGQIQAHCQYSSWCLHRPELVWLPINLSFGLCKTLQLLLWGDFRFSLKDPRMTPVAAIAGGTVGSVVGVAILVGLGWWFWKKRSTRDQAGNSAVDENSSKGGQVAHPSVVEVDAGPDSVLVESDARTTQPSRMHELAA